MRQDTIPTAPGALPLLGHLIPLLRGPLAFMRSLPGHGDLVRIQLGPLSVVMACDPAAIRQVLRDDHTFDKGGFFYERAAEVGGQGLVTCPHSMHRTQRRMCQPAFRTTRLPDHTTAMTTQADTASSGWHDGQTIDVPEEMMALAVRNLAATMFSDELRPETLQHMTHDVDAIVAGFFGRLIMPGAVSRLPLPATRRYEQALTRLRTTLAAVITDRRAHPGDQDDLLSQLLTQGPHAPYHPATALTDKEITDQFITFFIAGAETVASTLSWALDLLTRHPDTLRGLRTEIDTVLAGRPVTYDDFPRLPLTGRVITETLRLYPAGWIYTRTATTDTTLAGTPIPAGTTLAYSPYLLHHNPAVHPDPERFDPDRWLPERAEATSRDHYIPFGGGPRKCIGEQFALTEATATLATIVQNWHLHRVSHGPVRTRRATPVHPRDLRLRLNSRTPMPQTSPTTHGA
ncbi:cytochrome P450 [Streptomyces sp. WAC07149]|uniref:cytochrome P450 n=1 Tax=Streptomyces sp. WAC07149 TaxID=2487425 RepID=UPI000F76674D|nr:cytochrome P450 [Streptomyces sp. WAC07149]RST00739.1 cytochrome P450 [Streptomyces sp. WAC07149]